MRVATSVSDFGRLYGAGGLYVDKTSFLQEWWYGIEDVTLITRPRRFGKTLTLSMIEHFFSPLYKGEKKRDGTPLFEGLAVWKDSQMRALQGTIPVISITISGVNDATAENIAETLSEQVMLRCDDYLSLIKNNPSVEKEEVDLIRSFSYASNLKSQAYALKRLCKVLAKAYQVAPILLMDEYDSPLTEAFLQGTLEETILPLQSFFTKSYKDNKYFSKCLITGITRIGQKSLFSGFNNPVIDTMLSSDYPTLMGYTQEEVESLLRQAALQDSLSDVKRMYDGYRIAEQWDIYNPYSINQFLSKKKLKNYWIDTSASVLPKQIITEGSYDIQQAVINLLNGEAVWTEIPTNLVYENLYTDKYAALSLLFFSGYLKAVEEKKIEDSNDYQYQVEIPNQEVRNYYRTTITNWLDQRFSRNQKTGGTKLITDFCQALLAEDKEQMTRTLCNLAETFVGSADAAGGAHFPPENFYHGLVLGILINLSARYEIRSNGDSGLGRFDLSLIPKLQEGKVFTKADHAYCIELKVRDKDDTSLLDAALRALKQIEEKHYIQAILNAGVPKEQIYCFGIGFHGREVLVANGTEPAPAQKETKKAAKVTGSETTKKKVTKGKSQTSENLPLILKQPEDSIGKMGAIIPLNVISGREDVTYQWYYREEGEGGWKKSRIKGNKTYVLLVTGNAVNARKWFKCLLVSPDGTKEESNEARILLEAKD